MKNENRLKKCLIFCHRNSIANQWKISAEKIGVKIEEWETNSLEKELLIKADGWAITYQSASKNIERLKKELHYWANGGLLSIADEAHHLGVDPNGESQPLWGKSFSDLSTNSLIRIGLTGTPFRSDNLAFCSAKKIKIRSKGQTLEQITPDLCIEPRQLIEAGDVRPLEFRFQDGWVEHSVEGNLNSDISALSTEPRENWRARNLRRAIRLSDKSSIASQLLIKAKKKLNKVRCSHSNAAGLVIARDIEHAKSIAMFLEEDGERVELVHSQDPEAGKRLASFQESNSNWLVSVDMCSEGFDAPRLRVVAYLTTIVTRNRFIQGITRAVRMSNSRSNIEPVPRNPSYVFAPADPLLIDYAKNWSSAQPYLITANQNILPNENQCAQFRGALLPLEAVNDKASTMIKMNPVELPSFLKS